MKARRVMATVLSGLILATMGISCSQDDSASKDGKVTLEVAVSGSAQELEIHQKKFDEYMKQNENVTIKPIDIGADRVQKTLTLISAGEAPDVLYINEMLYAFAAKGVLEPLDSYVEKDNFDLSQFNDNLMDPLTYKGKLYGLPQEISPFVIYYNKDMFKAAGVPLPTDDWTQEEFYEAAKKLTNPDKKVYGFRMPANWPDQIWGWLSRTGAEYDVTGDKSVGFDSPKLLGGLEFLHNMVHVDKVSPNPADLTAMGKGADVMFVNQTVAMESAGLWMLPQYKANPLDFEWDVVKMPKNENQNTLAGVLNWGMSKSSKHKDETWDLLKFLTGPDSMKIVAEAGMALPGSKDEEALKIVSDSKFPNNVNTFIESVENVDFRTQKNIYYTEIGDALNAQIELMLLGKQTPKQTQKAIIEKFDSILSGK